ncbi:hypothetical protein P2A10_21250, partial [Xanthomonas perforans]
MADAPAVLGRCARGCARIAVHADDVRRQLRLGAARFRRLPRASSRWASPHHLPMQKLEKILPSRSSALSFPVISPSA